MRLAELKTQELIKRYDPKTDEQLHTAYFILSVDVVNLEQELWNSEHQSAFAQHLIDDIRHIIEVIDGIIMARMVERKMKLAKVTRKFERDLLTLIKLETLYPRYHTQLNKSSDNLSYTFVISDPTEGGWECEDLSIIMRRIVEKRAYEGDRPLDFTIQGYSFKTYEFDFLSSNQNTRIGYKLSKINDKIESGAISENEGQFLFRSFLEDAGYSRGVAFKIYTHVTISKLGGQQHDRAQN